MADPFPKRKQLARPHRRAKRHVPTRAEWAAIVAEKQGPCRVCCDPGHNGSLFGRIQLHHLVPRALMGDDVADNIVPLCLECHAFVTGRSRLAVNPAHYADLGEYSALHVTERWGLGYHLGQALKYMQRAGRHPSQSELTDLRKARWYLQRYLHLLAPDAEFDPATDRTPERW